MQYGTDGNATDASTSNPLPVTLQYTGANTTAVKVDGSAVTQPVSIAAAVPVNDNSGSLTIDSTQLPAALAANGGLKIEGVSGGVVVPVSDGSGSLTVDAPVGTPVFVRLSDGSAAITTLPVSLASVPSHAVTNAGTFAVQVDGSALTSLQLIDDVVATAGSAALTKGNQVCGTDGTNARVISTNSSGHVSINDGSNSITVDGTITASNTAGDVASGSSDSGNPVKVGARSVSTLATATLLSAAQRANAIADLDGAHIVRNQFPLGDLITERVSNTDGNSTAFTNFSAVASTRNYITAISVHNAHATTNGYIDFRDGTGGSVLYTLALPANGGAVISGGGLPIFRTSTNTALAYDVSAAITTVYVSVSGYQSKC